MGNRAIWLVGLTIAFRLSTASAQDAAGGITILGPTAVSVDLAADDTHPYLTGDVTLLIENAAPEEVTLSFSFILTDSPDLLPAVQDTPTEVAAGQIALIAPDGVPVPGRAVLPVTVAFALPVDQAKAVTGTLIATSASSPPATITLTLSPPSSVTDWSKVKTSRDSLATRFTRVGFLWFGDSCMFNCDWEVTLTNLPAGLTADAIKTQIGTTSLFSSDNQRMAVVAETVTLTCSDPAATVTGSNCSSATVTLGPRESGYAGTYKGTLKLDPGNKDAPSLALELKAQDSPLFPALLLAIAGFGAFRLTAHQNRKRPKQAMKAALREAEDSYQESKKTRPTLPDDNRPWSVLPPSTLVAQIEAAATKEALDALLPKVQERIKIVRSWQAAYDQAEKLKAGLAEFTTKLPVPEAETLTAATTELLGSPLPATDAGITAYTQRLADQATALTLWATLWTLGSELLTLHQELTQDASTWTPQAQQELLLADPEGVMRSKHGAVALEHATGLAYLSEHALDARIREIAATLERLDRNHPRPVIKGVNPILRGFAGPGIDLGNLLSILGGTTADVLPPVKEIRASMLRWDAFEFAVTATGAALTALLLLYNSGDFGTWRQYATLIIGGVTTTFVASWALLPWNRSYTVK